MEVPKFSPSWPVLVMCWYGFSAFSVPVCDATCVVRTQLFNAAIKHSQPRLKRSSKAEREFTEDLLLPQLRHWCNEHRCGKTGSFCFPRGGSKKKFKKQNKTIPLI